ncbi:MAG: hypothetical protein ACYSR1_10045 [Planctomycetota bacterium]
MKKKRFFIFIVILTITELGTMTGCSQNQETLTWPAVTRDIRNKFPDVKQLQTAELLNLQF